LLWRSGAELNDRATRQRGARLPVLEHLQRRGIIRNADDDPRAFAKGVSEIGGGIGTRRDERLHFVGRAVPDHDVKVSAQHRTRQR